jgi:hydroxymethylpyrimidine pyrophosphatase-like HAD family hydrolase
VKYKLLAVDIDGTLLRRDGTIHPDDIAAIARLQARGVPVTLITGRLYSGSSAVARSIPLVGPIACVDGSHIVDLGDNNALFYRSISGEAAALLRDTLARHEAASFLFAQDSIVHDALGEPFAGYVRTWSPKVDVVERVTAHPFWEHELGLMAVVAVGAEAHITAARDELRVALGRTAVVISFPVSRGAGGVFAMLVRAAGPTKGTAVRWLAEHYGCDVEEVVAVGDWLNDVPMFQVAGRSFAMKQAPPEVKEAATDELEAHGEDGGGVAEAIDRAFGI